MVKGTSPRRPGKSGQNRGITSATSSENAMKTAAVPPNPSFWLVVSARSTAGTYPTLSRPAADAGFAGVGH